MRKHPVLFILCLLAGTISAQESEYKLFPLGGDRGWQDNVSAMADEHYLPATRNDLQTYLTGNSVTLIYGLRRSPMHSTKAGWDTVVALDTSENGRVTYLVHDESRRDKFSMKTAPADTTWAVGTMFLGKRK